MNQEFTVHMDDNLLSRKVKNVGKATVHIEQDKNFTEHVLRHHKKPVTPVTLHVGESVILRNFYIIATTADGSNVSLEHTFYKE